MEANANRSQFINKQFFSFSLNIVFTSQSNEDCLVMGRGWGGGSNRTLNIEQF